MLTADGLSGLIERISTLTGEASTSMWTTAAAADDTQGVIVSAYVTLLTRRTQLLLSHWQQLDNNMPSKMSFLFSPKSRISFKIASKIIVFVQISSTYWKAVNLQTDKYVIISTSVQKKCSISLYYSSLFFVEMLGVLLMYALILYCATSMLRDTKIYSPKCYASSVWSH